MSRIRSAGRPKGENTKTRLFESGRVFAFYPHAHSIPIERNKVRKGALGSFLLVVACATQRDICSGLKTRFFPPLSLFFFF